MADPQEVEGGHPDGAMDGLQPTAHRHQQEEVHQQVLKVGMDQGVADIPPTLSGPVTERKIEDTY